MTNSDFFLACGILSACLSICAFLPYITSMIAGQTKPLRSTWLIWSVLSTMSALTNLAEGATFSMLFVGIQAAFTCVIFLMSLRYGTGAFLTATDGRILTAAAIGLGIWWVTHNAVWALGIAIGISALGGLATIAKTYRAPGSESATCWTLSCIATVFGILSVGSADPVLLAYPAYLMVLYIGILAAMHLGQRRLAARPAPATHYPLPIWG